MLCAHSDRGFHHVQIEGGVVETHGKQPSMMVAISFCLLRLYIGSSTGQKQVRSAASRCDCIYILKTLTLVVVRCFNFNNCFVGSAWLTAKQVFLNKDRRELSRVPGVTKPKRCLS